MRWDFDQVDRLERAIAEERRVQLRARGGEFVVLARELRSEGSEEVLLAVHPSSGEQLRFPLDSIEWFVVL